MVQWLASLCGCHGFDSWTRGFTLMNYINGVPFKFKIKVLVQFNNVKFASKYF